jgi:hypothetical protein
MTEQELLIAKEAAIRRQEFPRELRGRLYHHDRCKNEPENVDRVLSQVAYEVRKGNYSGILPHANPALAVAIFRYRNMLAGSLEDLLGSVGSGHFDKIFAEIYRHVTEEIPMILRLAGAKDLAEIETLPGI